MEITIPLGATIIFMLIRIAVGAALTVIAMRRGMCPSLRVGWTLKFDAMPYRSEPGGQGCERRGRSAS